MVVVLQKEKAVGLRWLRVPVAYRFLRVSASKHDDLQTARAERDHRRSCHEELVLHNPAGLEQRGHESEVRCEVTHEAVCEELVRTGLGVTACRWKHPEAIAVMRAKVLHLAHAVATVGVVGVRNAADDDLDVTTAGHDEFFSDLAYEMNALLLGDAAHEHQQGNREVLHPEILLLHE